jgi:hypothetical protein
MSARAVLAAFGAALAFVAAACARGEGDKAGGMLSGQPLVLTLESEDDLSLTGAPEFAEAVERVSEARCGSSSLPPRESSRTSAAGRRSWESSMRGLGHIRGEDLQGMLAPLLVDSLELERQVLESPLATRMLESVERAGVVESRSCRGRFVNRSASRIPWSGPTTRGTTMGMRPYNLVRTALRVLGAGAKVYVPGVLSGLDGTDSNLKAIDYNSWKGALTANVVLWPKPYTIFMNRDARQSCRNSTQPSTTHRNRFPRRAHAEGSPSSPRPPPSSQRCARQCSPSTRSSRARRERRDSNPRPPA